MTANAQREMAQRLEALAWSLLALARQLREAKGGEAAALWAAACEAVGRVQDAPRRVV